MTIDNNEEFFKALNEFHIAAANPDDHEIKAVSRLCDVIEAHTAKEIKKALKKARKGKKS